jgi:hypothetical protein
MKALLAAAVGTLTLLATGAAYAVSGHVVNEVQGVEAGAWAPILFTVLVFGFVNWVLVQLGKPLERLEE